MLRRVFTSASALSLLCCLGLCAIWARSYAVEDQLVWQLRDGGCEIHSGVGDMLVGLNLTNWSKWPRDFQGLNHTRTTPATSPASSMIDMYVLSIGPRDVWVDRSFAGISWVRWKAASGGSSRTRLLLPFWSAAAAIAMLPLAWLALRWLGSTRRRRRGLRGLCRGCGYDLRASTEICPECGTPLAACGA